MLEFSASLSSIGLPTNVKTEQDVDALMGGFEKKVKALNLWQYYVLDVTKEKESVKSALTSGKITSWKGPDVTGKSAVELAEITRASGFVNGLGKLAARLGVHVDGGVAAGLIKATSPGVTDADVLAESWGKVVDVLNVPLYAEWEEDTKIALESVKNRLKYTRLEEGGPKMGEITET